jgi:hypothetical protein
MALLSSFVSNSPTAERYYQVDQPLPTIVKMIADPDAIGKISRIVGAEYDSKIISEDKKITLNKGKFEIIVTRVKETNLLITPRRSERVRINQLITLSPEKVTITETSQATGRLMFYRLELVAIKHGTATRVHTKVWLEREGLFRLRVRSARIMCRIGLERLESAIRTVSLTVNQKKKTHGQKTTSPRSRMGRTPDASPLGNQKPIRPQGNGVPHQSSRPLR